MPPKRGRKKSGKAAATTAPSLTPEVDAPTNGQAMQTDEPAPSTSGSVLESATELIEKAEEVVEHAAEAVAETVTDVAHAAEQFVDKMTGIEEGSSSSGNATPGDIETQPEQKEETQKMTLEERKAKLDQLRKKMAASSRANRASLVEEASKAKVTARETARLERQRKLAETLRLKADAEERGEDVERAKNWEYTIEENEEWEKKQARKKRRADFEFHDDAHAARRRYKKDLDQIKPDLEAYNKQKAIAMGHAGSLVGFNSTAGSSSEVAIISQEQRLAAENLYRDANTLIYGDNKPTEDAIDRVVSKINKDIDKKGKFSRKRLNEEEGDITYINEHNRVFNKKIARYYDKYTSEIRASFERGTAL
ncbi:SYF2-domain-containing protein [Pholiota conissans]|uniref:Pre-mRNA-splicing factor SYF2 n=1 Tax=Pholiota conissans TaxID=109636 RepID=A0A9P5ZDD8_9AGAR|nr:SYF2-domain-containing protein [Pholiota conissans]